MSNTTPYLEQIIVQQNWSTYNHDEKDPVLPWISLPKSGQLNE